VLSAVELSLVLYVASLLTIWYTTGGFSFVSPVHIYLFFYTVYVYIWAIVLFLGDPQMVGAVSLPQPDGRLLGMTTLGLVAFALGAFAFAAATRFAPRAALARRRLVPVVNDLRDQSARLTLFIVILTGASLAAAFFALKGFPITAYFQAIGDPTFFRVMSEAREESLTGSGYFLQGITTVLPVGVLLMFASSRLSHSRIGKSLTWVAICIVIALMFSLTSRGHFAMFLIVLLITGQAIDGRMQWGRVGLWVCAFFVLFAGSSLVKLGMLENSEGVLSALAAAWNVLLERLSLGVKQMHALLLLVPQEHPFLLGRGFFWDARALLPGADVGFNRWGFELMYPAVAVPANITPTSIGEWYANFGVVGVISISALMGGTLQACHQELLRVPQSASRVVLLVFISSYLAKSAINGTGAMFEPMLSGLCTFGLYFVGCRFLSTANAGLASRRLGAPASA